MPAHRLPPVAKKHLDLALIFQIFAALKMISSLMGVPSGNAISYLSSFHGAALFFLLAIANWCRTAKS